MKYCINARLKEQADEIYIEQRDQDVIYDYLEGCASTIVLECADTLFDIELLKLFNERLEGRFYCELSSFNRIKDLKENGIKFFYNKPITNTFDLKNVINIGVSQVLIGGSLFFDMKTVKQIIQDSGREVLVRVCPHKNIVSEVQVPLESSCVGTWILPQMTDLYEDYVDVFEIQHPSITRARTLYKIYSKDKKWGEQIGLLIDDYPIGGAIYALALEPELYERRLSCGHHCDMLRCSCCYSNESQAMVAAKLAFAAKSAT